jgi:hypothetical protein
MRDNLEPNHKQSQNGASQHDGGAALVVVVMDRHVEQRHDRVADVFVDKAAVPGDDAARRAQKGVHDLVRALGAQLVGQLGERSAGGLAGGLISADVSLQRERPRVVRRAVAGAAPAVLEQESRDLLQRRHRRNRDDHPDQAEGVAADQKGGDQQNRMKVNAPADGYRTDKRDIAKFNTQVEQQDFGERR